MAVWQSANISSAKFVQSYSFFPLNTWLRQAYRLIVSMEFTTGSSARTLRFQRVLHTGGGRRARGSRGNPNGVIYAVAVKTDLEIIVGILLRQILTACSLFLRWSGTIVCDVTGCRRAPVDQPKGGFVRCSIRGKSCGLEQKYPNYGQTTAHALLRASSAK